MKQFIYIYLLAILGIFQSCWPTSVSFVDKGGMPAEWKVFSLKNIDNEANNAPLSYAIRLTEDLKDGIQNGTKLRISSGKSDSAQINIEGKIVNYQVSPVALQPGDNAAKNRLTISASFEIFASKPKEEKYQVSTSRFADFDSNKDLPSVEAQLIEEINKQILQDVINKLNSNW